MPVPRRSIFVGRERELARLTAALDDAIAGQGGVVAITGEPGIGKTRLVTAFAEEARQAGALTLVGRCFEDDWSPPYSAFVEALEAHVQAGRLNLPDGIGPAMARIIPSLGQSAEVYEDGEQRPEALKYQLFQAIAAFLRSLAADGPICLILEDLHVADGGTLDLLTHLSRQLNGTRVLVVITYRSIELPPEHPLSQALVAIDRASSLYRLSLDGLAVDEVGALVKAEMGRDAAAALTSLVWQRSEGNPLFVREIARSLSPVGSNFELMELVLSSIPAAIRDAVSTRLANLSPPCRDLLAIAAVIGTEFDTRVLALAAQMDEPTRIRAFGEAVSAAFLTERMAYGGVRCVFSHALLREVVYREIPLYKRAGMHVQIGRILERWSPPSAADEAALAEHFSFATDPAELANAVNYAALAARSAASVYAHDEAAALLDRAIAIQVRLDPGDTDRLCTLYLALCETLIYAQRSHPDHTTMVAEAGYNEDATRDCPLLVAAEAAYARAMLLNDRARASRVCELALLDCMFGRSPGAFRSGPGRTWVDRADKVVPGQTRARVFVDTAFVNTLPLDGEELRSRIERAIAVARELGDPEALHMAGMTALLLVRSAGLGPDLDVALARSVLDQVWVTPRDTVSPGYAAAGLMACVADDLWCGRRERLDAAISQAEDLALRTGAPAAEARGRVFRWTQLTLEGQLATVLEEIPDQSQNEARHLETLHIGWYRPALYLGRSDELRRAVEVSKYGRSALETHFLAFAGDERAKARLRDHTSAGWRAAPMLVLFLEAAIRLGDIDQTSARLAQVDRLQAATTAFDYPTIVDRHRGDGLALLGHVDKARDAYQSALAIAHRMHWRPEIALILLSQSRLRLEHGAASREEALTDLEVALSEFVAMSMQPYVDEATALLKRYRDRVAHPAGLSEREVAVLRLIARGRSNAAIAEELVIAQSTVARHVSNILNKTGLSNRTEAAAWAMAQRLTEPGTPGA